MNNYCDKAGLVRTEKNRSFFETSTVFKDNQRKFLQVVTLAENETKYFAVFKLSLQVDI